EDIEKEVGKGKIRPIYIIVGAEHHLALEALSVVRKAVEDAGADPISFQSVPGREVRAEAVISSLRTVPMLGGRPLVILREGESIPKDAMEALASYMEKPVESSTLVIVAEKLDGRTKFMQAAAKNGAVIECRPLYLDKVPPWISRETRRKGRQIAQAAAEFMANMVGADLGQLSEAIDRVILYVGDKKIIELKDVEQAVAETHQHTIFEMTDAVGQRNWPKAFAFLTNILENGEPPVLVLGMLSRHFRILSKAKEAAGRVADGELAKYLGVHPYYARNYLAQSRNFSAGELRRAFRLLHRCDRELKSSRIPKGRVLERVLLELMGQKGAAPKRGGAV
nr:DNA polymerase III subunit delta [bacterium]